MAKYLQIIVPVCLILYFIFESRKKISGLIALFLFPTFGKNAYIFPELFNNRIKPIDFQFLLVFILFLIIVRKRPLVIKGRFAFEKFIELSLVVLILIHVGQGVINGFPSSIIPQTYRVFIYYVIGLFMWNSILKRITRAEFEEFLRILTIPTVLLSLLYILSAIGVDIYLYDPYISTYAGNALIVRDFATYPFFSFISLIYLILYSKLDAKPLISLGLLTISTFFLYTRVYTFQWLLIIVLGFCWRYLRKGQKTKQILKILGAAGFLILLIYSINVFFPSSYDYYFSRIGEFINSGFQTSTFKVRTNLSEMAITSLINDGRLWLGNGIRNYFSLDLGLINAPLMDSPIAYFLYFLGISGFSLLIIQMISISITSLTTAFSNKFENSRLGMLLFLAIFIFTLSIISESYVYDGVVGAMWVSAIGVHKGKTWRKNSEVLGGV